jgi:hypothetical protein
MTREAAVLIHPWLVLGMLGPGLQDAGPLQFVTELDW